MAPVLKTGIPERVSGVRIPPSPPDSLSCRDIRLHYRENRKKLPQLDDSCPRTGPEKVLRRTPLTPFAAFFSGWQTFGPVFNHSVRRIACDHKPIECRVCRAPL